MRTITGYGSAVIIILAILYGIAWLRGDPRLRVQTVFSAGFVLGMLGMYILAWLNGYRQVARR
jgi:formate hydrogenlyase subunit 3/multisubunit Na+/H+ antiporter MnhD subunit